MLIKSKKNRVFPLRMEDIKIVFPLNEEFDPDEIEVNKSKLKNDDKTDPITVAFSSEGYRLVYGLNIYYAYLQLERKIIPSIIKR